MAPAEEAGHTPASPSVLRDSAADSSAPRGAAFAAAPAPRQVQSAGLQGPGLGPQGQRDWGGGTAQTQLCCQQRGGQRRPRGGRSRRSPGGTTPSLPCWPRRGSARGRCSQDLLPPGHRLQTRRSRVCALGGFLGPPFWYSSNFSSPQLHTLSRRLLSWDSMASGLFCGKTGLLPVSGSEASGSLRSLLQSTGAPSARAPW